MFKFSGDLQYIASGDELNMPHQQDQHATVASN
jgi:hypothetical protein